MPISHANAAVTFLSLSTDAAGKATISANGGFPQTGVTAPHGASTTSLATAISTGVTSNAGGVSKSFGAGAAKLSASVSSNTVSAIVKSDDPGHVAFNFSGTASASTGSGGANAAYATAGDNGSSGVYTFSSSTSGSITITADVTSSQSIADSYLIDLYDLTTSTDFASFKIDSNDDVTKSFVIPAGAWKVTIKEAAGAHAADYVFVSGKGHAATGLAVGSFDVVVSVPELSTWAMFGLGLAGLGFLGARASRQSISIV